MTPKDSKVEDGCVAKKARVFNVLDYGACYFEDDTDSIQAAINADAIRAEIEAAVRER